MSTLRRAPLDGAMLFFDPATGLNVRVDAPSTRHLQRRAPRTLNFALSSACNLACGFCFRDHPRSRWTIETTHALLRELDHRGLLEVAFGGGEPLAWKGFDELLERLRGDTRLALNVTTNGTLLTAARARRLAPLVSEVRVSAYPETQWAQAVSWLVAAGVRTGVNVLVGPTTLPRLEALLGQCHELGCVDVAVLRAVGQASAFALGADDEGELEQVVRHSPVPLRLSTCFADRLPGVARLFDGDCGAGDDFVVITPDRQARACSFQREGVPFETADDLLEVWSARRTARPRAPGFGCGRRSGPPLSDGVRLWRTYSSNNSAECVLVGRFETNDAARHFADFLRPLLHPGAELQPELVAQLLERGVTPNPHELAPEVLEHSGPVVLMHTEMTLQGGFPSLATLVWREGGQVLSAGHLANPSALVSAVRPPAAQSAAAVEAELSSPGRVVVRKGRTLFVTHEWDEFHALAQFGAMSSEVVAGGPDFSRTLALAARRRLQPALSGWLFGTFPTAERAKAARVRGASVVERWVMLRSPRLTSRDGARIQAYGGSVLAIPGEALELHFSLQGARKHRIDVDAVASDLTVELGPRARPVMTPGTLWGTVVTDEPAALLRVLTAFASGRALSLYARAQPVNGLARALARLEADVTPR